MQKIAIVTDSNSGITLQEAKELGIYLISMPFMIDGNEYFEELTLSQDDFYRYLKDDNVKISTSQPSNLVVTELWDKLLKDYDAIYLPAAPDIAPKFQNTKQADRLSSEYLIADNHLCIANFAGLPSITLPIGMKEGMPFGANLTGRIFEEKKLFQIAKKVEEHTGLCGISARRSSWNLNQ